MLRGHHLYVDSPTSAPFNTTVPCSYLHYLLTSLSTLRLPLRDVLLSVRQPSSYDLIPLYLEDRVSRYHLLYALRSSYPLTTPIPALRLFMPAIL